MSRPEYVYASHLPRGGTAGSSLEVCPTCHLVQPCLMGLLVAASRCLPPLPSRSVEELRQLIVRCPDAVPLLLPVAAILAERMAFLGTFDGGLTGSTKSDAEPLLVQNG